MIRRLDPDDRELLVDYLERDRRNNLFLLANLAQLGLGHADLRYFCAYDAEGVWAGVLMLFRTTACVFWHDRRVLPSFKDILQRERATGLSGQKHQVDPLLNLLPDDTEIERIDATYVTIGKKDLRPWSDRGERLATLDDIELLADLYAQNLLFGQLDRDKHRARVESVLKSGGFITLVERDGLAVSAARTSAVGYGMSMIGGVLTLPAYRRRGFAQACVGLLSRALLDLGIEPCLTYTPADPAATGTYLGLGYQAIDEWIVAFLDT